MDRTQAKTCLQLGYKLRHEYFDKNEWVKQLPERPKYIFEDGNICEIDQFWKYRNDEKFNKNWSVIHEHKVGFEFILRHKPSIFSEEIVEQKVSIIGIFQRLTFNEYVLSNTMSFKFYELDGNIKDGVFEHIREPLSANDLR